jgi:hypothetical protein
MSLSRGGGRRRCARTGGEQQQQSPKASRETLDHSIMYIFAVALQDGTWHHVDSYTPRRAQRPDTVRLWHKIETVEGLAEGVKLHPLQQKFLENASLQCGICTPGFLMSAKALLDRNPHPTEAEIRYALAGNLCRCTGYDKIVHAVLEASKAGASRAA